MLYNNLDWAKKHQSRTKPVPFLIQHECLKKYRDRETGEWKDRTREFYAFDDIEAFIARRDRFPHAHEVIWDRYVSDKQQGRLMFDFDFEEPWYGVKPHFVSPGFEKDIEGLILRTFEKYYMGIDVTRFVFVWLVSDVETKWSKHLIVKNAYFCDDWKVQSKIFYNLMLSFAVAEGLDKRLPLDKLFDAQIARSNGGMRMLGSSKLGKDRILRLESPPGATLFDTLVQLHRREDIETEQNISISQVKRLLIDEEKREDQYHRAVCKTLDLQYESNEHAFDNDRVISADVKVTAYRIFEHHFCNQLKVAKQNCFKLGNLNKTLITLERIKAGPCLISGRVHDHSAAFLRVSTKGDVYFHCFRDCNIDGVTSIRCEPPDNIEISPDEFVAIVDCDDDEDAPPANPCKLSSEEIEALIADVPRNLTRRELNAQLIKTAKAIGRRK